MKRIAFHIAAWLGLCLTCWWLYVAMLEFTGIALFLKCLSIGWLYSVFLCETLRHIREAMTKDTLK